MSCNPKYLIKFLISQQRERAQTSILHSDRPHLKYKSPFKPINLPPKQNLRPAETWNLKTSHISASQTQPPPPARHLNLHSCGQSVRHLQSTISRPIIQALQPLRRNHIASSIQHQNATPPSTPHSSPQYISNPWAWPRPESRKDPLSPAIQHTLLTTLVVLTFQPATKPTQQATSSSWPLPSPTSCLGVSRYDRDKVLVDCFCVSEVK